jgi:hypothetical protein
MARGTTLGELLTKLRIAARYDPNPSLSKNMEPLFLQTVQDVQERLYDEFDWPFLKIQRDKTLAAGQRYYDLPDDMNLERVFTVDTLISGHWCPVERGISLDDYSGCNSDAGARRDPVERWDVIDTGDGMQIEVWPVPVSNGGTIRFRGIRNLAPLVNSADKADLDDQLIVSFAAGELLAGKGEADQAQLKLKQGANRLQLLQGRSTKRRNGGFVLGGGPDYDDRRHGYPRGVTVVATQPS